ncbi:MAG: glycosyltransferase family 39 protein, partial [Candidatus Eisenbacteria sp.]|nr:glycosyltransferase family 39 protein [Candidatus Eisenbacteria bacterium]
MSRTRHESASTSVPRMRPVTPGRAPRAWVWFLLLLVAAAGIRFAYLADVSDAPDIMNPILDSNWNRTQALRIAGGECLPDGPFWRPPGYQYFLAPLFMTARGDPLLSRIVQILLSAATCGLIYLIGRRVFGHGVGLLAGALAAAYQMSIYFSVELLPTTLEVFANALMLWFLLVAEEKRTAGWWIAGGALLGFSAIVRPTVLVFAVLLIIFVKGFRLWRGSWRPALALGAGALVVILPVTAINLVHGRDAVFIASQGGVNFYIGNGPYADGKTVLLRGTYEAEYSHGLGEYQDQVHLMSVAMAEQATGRGMKPSAIDRYWYGKAIESIRDGPGRFAGLLLRKLYYFWNSQETSNNRNIGLFIREHSPWLRWPLPWFGLIAPLGIVGLVAAWRRGRGVRLLTLFLLGQMIAVVLFFVTARFRMPAVMALLVFASYGVFWLVGRIRATDWARAALGVVSLAALLGVVHTGCLGVRRTPDLGIQYFNQAVALLREERVEEAAGLMRLVTRINPSDPMIHCALGSTLLRMDCYAEAEESYERALAIRPSN